MAESRAEVEEIVRELEQVQEAAALAEAYSMLGTLLMWTGFCAESMDALERSVSLARQAGADEVANRSLVWLLVAAIWGPMPVHEALALCERVRGEGGRLIEDYADMTAGHFHRMAGDWERGTELIQGGRKGLLELGQHVNAASTRMASARAEYFVGRLEAAEEELRLGYAELESMGDKGYLSTVVAILALVLCAQGRYDEAEEAARNARGLGAEDDFTTELYWRYALAEVLASRGEFDDARRFLDEADEQLEGTDYIADSAAALISRATVENAAGNPEAAKQALQTATALLERKGDVTAATFTRQRLAAL
jgi:tetratricopeptide (TPR) repeat protein